LRRDYGEKCDEVGRAGSVGVSILMNILHPTFLGRMQAKVRTHHGSECVADSIFRPDPCYKLEIGSRRRTLSLANETLEQKAGKDAFRLRHVYREEI